MVIYNSINDAAVVADLLAGKVGVIPTDTVYGLACSAADQAAVDRLYQLKSREHKPGTAIAANAEQLIQLGLKARYVKAVEYLWPNPISIILPDPPELEYLDMGLKCLAVRIPADENIRQLLLQTGPLMTSSANLPGRPTGNNLKEAQAYFNDQVDFYVDGGDLSANQSSTLVKIIDDEVIMLREGAITRQQIDNILNNNQ